MTPEEKRAFSRSQLVDSGSMKKLSGKRLKKAPAMLYPLQAERRLEQLINSFLVGLREFIALSLPSTLEESIRQARDAWTDPLNLLLDQTNLFIDRSVNAANAELLDIGQYTSEWNNNQWRKTMKAVLGVSIYSNDTFSSGEKKIFVDNATGLIKDLGTDIRKKVSSAFTSGIVAGDSYKTISKNILGTGIDSGVFGSVQYRSRLIARDQIGKLNGNLTEWRQTEIGIENYIWRTALDERVRDQHEVRNGKKFNWKKPPDGGHPGMAIQCRCYAEADFSDLFNDGEIITN